MGGKGNGGEVKSDQTVSEVIHYLLLKQGDEMHCEEGAGEKMPDAPGRSSSRFLNELLWFLTPGHAQCRSSSTQKVNTLTHGFLFLFTSSCPVSTEMFKNLSLHNFIIHPGLFQGSTDV